MHKILSIFVLILFAQCELPEKRKSVSKKIGPSQSSHILKNAADSFKYLCQYWKLLDADDPLGKDVDGEADSGVYNSPGLLFLSDSSLVENPRGIIRFGRFGLSGKRILAKFDDGQESHYIINRFRGGKLELTRKEKQHETSLKMSGDSVHHEIAESNPFHPVHNRWRIKPAKSETEQQLKERLKQYMDFYIRFFDDNLKRSSQSIDFEGLPCCFNWYKGGIGVQNAQKLDPKFALCFYSDVQAQKAREMMEDVITKKYKWVPDIDNWVEQTLPVLRQIKDSL